MAKGRDYLQSIIASAAVLQNLSDEALDDIRDGLARVDDDLSRAVEYIGGYDE